MTGRPGHGRHRSPYCRSGTVLLPFAPVHSRGSLALTRTLFEPLGDSHDCRAFYSRNSGRIQINVGTRLRIAIVGQSRKKKKKRKRKRKKKGGSDSIPPNLAPRLTHTRFVPRLFFFFFPSSLVHVVIYHRHLLSLQAMMFDKIDVVLRIEKILNACNLSFARTHAWGNESREFILLRNNANGMYLVQLAY